MIVQLIDFDSTIPNIAIMRLSTYHKAKGDKVRFSRGKHPSVRQDVSVIYISVIYKKNKRAADILIDSLTNEYVDNPPTIDVGGSGYDVKKVLPPEVEACAPDYSLYPENDSSYGFSSRGCVRRCSFCIVKDKEGAYRRTDHPEKWYNPDYKKITFLDNNPLADPEYFFELVDWCLEHGLTIRFLSGFDIRLLTREIADKLYAIKDHHTLSFAWDNIGDEAVIRQGIEILRQAGFSNSDSRACVQFYVYTDSDAEYDSALYRCQELKKVNTNAFVMYNIDNPKTRRIQDLQRWSNRKWLFWSYDISNAPADDLMDEWV